MSFLVAYELFDGGLNFLTLVEDSDGQCHTQPRSQTRDNCRVPLSGPSFL